MKKTGPYSKVDEFSNVPVETLIEILLKEFYAPFKSQSSEKFLVLLKSKYRSVFANMKSNNKDDTYGTFTLTMSYNPSNLEFTLKQPEAYGGPKTEHYLERIGLKVEAANKWIDNNLNITKKEKKEKSEKITKVGYDFKKMILNNCKIDHKLIGRVPKNKDIKEYFNKVHSDAKILLAAFMKKLISEIQVNENKLKTSKIKNELYLIECELMSKKRPEKITMRQIDIGEKEAHKTYYEACVTAPMDRERTVSSAKKNEAGVANWLKCDNIIYSENFEKIDHRTTYRSASFVPHDIINKGTKDDKVDDFVDILVYDTAKRNLVEHILPKLAEEYLKKNPVQEDLKYPLKINFEMLTLISPIAILDKIIDPDKTQFEAMRDAINYCSGLKNFSLPVNGVERDIEFSGIYHNYGVNSGRGFSFDEKRNNARAFYKVLLRSKAKLSSEVPEHFSPIADMIKDLPPYDNNSIVVNKIQQKESELFAYYKIISALDHFSKQNHSKLLALYAKKINKQLLSGIEFKEYSELRREFISNHNKLKRYQNGVLKLENKIELYCQKFSIDVVNEFKERSALLKKTIDNVEKGKKYNLDKALRYTVDHIRTLIEYIDLYIKGYDPKFSLQGNKKNYEIQSYIENLNRYHDSVFYQTCKSGKDRTNAALEKQKAKKMMQLYLNRVIRYLDDPELKMLELTLFEDGYLQGPGNDICGDNMKPATQQLSSDDISCTVNLSMLREVAVLQKGIDKLKLVFDERIDAIMQEDPQLNKVASAASAVHSSTLANKEYRSFKDPLYAKERHKIISPNAKLLGDKVTNKAEKNILREHSQQKSEQNIKNDRSTFLFENKKIFKKENLTKNNEKIPVRVIPRKDKDSN